MLRPSNRSSRFMLSDLVCLRYITYISQNLRKSKTNETVFLQKHWFLQWYYGSCYGLRHFLEVSRCAPSQQMAPPPARSDGTAVQIHPDPSSHMAVLHQALYPATCPVHAAAGSVHLAFSAPWNLERQMGLSGVHEPATTSLTVNYWCPHPCNNQLKLIYWCSHPWRS